MGAARLLHLAFAGLVLPAAGLASAAAANPLPTSYVATPQFDGGPELRTARKGAPLAEYHLTPELAVELQGTLDPEIARRSAVQAKHPFTPGRMLYGWRDRPGLFCDLMRNRGLGSSTACLRDSNLDGRFDEAVRYDFNSAGADLVFITDKNKVRGGKLDSNIPLATPLAYRAAPQAAMPFARVRLLWNVRKEADAAGVKRPMVELVVTDGNNFTGTEILSEQLARIPLGDRPIELTFYGLKLGIAGLTADGGLSYSAQRLDGGTTIGFVFRGYTFRIMII